MEIAMCFSILFLTIESFILWNKRLKKARGVTFFCEILYCLSVLAVILGEMLLMYRNIMLSSFYLESKIIFLLFFVFFLIIDKANQVNSNYIRFNEARKKVSYILICFTIISFTCSIFLC